MPKRVIDGRGLWRSDKIARIAPEIKAEYANLLPLAFANGTFEANPRLVWVEVYSYNRPEITIEQVDHILAELERVKLLFRWVDQASGKTWGYWIGIHKPGRLPAASRLSKRHETVGPEPPQEQIEHFLKSDGQPMASHNVANGSPGFGFGFGSGSGINPMSEEKGSSDAKKTAPRKQTTKPPSKEGAQLAALLKSEIRRNKADCRITEQQGRNWAVTADRMLRIDGRTQEQIADLIRWVQHDDFEMSNVMSMEKLRDRFDALELKRQRARDSSNGNGNSYQPRPMGARSLSQIQREQVREGLSEC